jgi:hypothetical protein
MVTFDEVMYNFMIYRWLLLRMGNVLDKICRDKQNTHFVLRYILQKSCRLWDNVEKYGNARQAIDYNIIWCMHFACWIIGHRHKHSEYVILAGFVLQQQLRKSASLLLL